MHAEIKIIATNSIYGLWNENSSTEVAHLLPLLSCSAAGFSLPRFLKKLGWILLCLF
jgi:hypothetical protein